MDYTHCRYLGLKVSMSEFTKYLTTSKHHDFIIKQLLMKILINIFRGQQNNESIITFVLI